MRKQTKTYKLTATIWREGRYFVSKCPELGVASYGKTLESAIAALHEAVKLYLSNAKKLGFLKELSPILESNYRFTAQLNIAA